MGRGTWLWASTQHAFSWAQPGYLLTATICPAFWLYRCIFDPFEPPQKCFQEVYCNPCPGWSKQPHTAITLLVVDQDRLWGDSNLSKTTKSTFIPCQLWLLVMVRMIKISLKGVASFQRRWICKRAMKIVSEIELVRSLGRLYPHFISTQRWLKTDL